MALHHVEVVLRADSTGEVLIDGVKLRGATAVQITGAVRERPQVQITLVPDRVTADLPDTDVTVLRPGGAAEFADALNPARLQGLALQHMDHDPDATHGEAYAAALAVMAAEFEAQ